MATTAAAAAPAPRLALLLLLALLAAAAGALDAGARDESRRIGVDGTGAGALPPVAAADLRAALAPLAGGGWRMAALYEGPLAGALAHPSELARTVLAVVPGGAPPARRAEGQPFLSAAPGALPGLSLGPLNAAAGALEAALGGRRLFPLSVRLMDGAGGEAARGSGEGGAWCGPLIVYEVSSGAVLLSPSLVAPLEAAGGAAQAAVSRLAALLFDALPAAATAAGVGAALAGAAAARGAVLAAARVALAAAPPPMWFCLACPALLGLLAPLAINFGIGEARVSGF